MSAADDFANSFAKTAEDVLAVTAVDPKSGLTNSAVTARREQYGWNELASIPEEPWWKKFLGQFDDVAVWILLVAALISGVMGAWTNTAAIAAIVLLNAVLGYFQEERAERALAALQSLAAPLAKVIRDGSLATIPACELVSGDIVELEAGDNVPADVRLLQAFAVRVQEASLTGESVPVEKQADDVVVGGSGLRSGGTAGHRRAGSLRNQLRPRRRCHPSPDNDVLRRRLWRTVPRSACSQQNLDVLTTWSGDESVCVRRCGDLRAAASQHHRLAVHAADLRGEQPHAARMAAAGPVGPGSGHGD